MNRKSLLAIRIRGTINVPTRVGDTLRMLRIDRNNTSTLLDDRSEFKGMLQKAKDYITWGNPSLETIRLLLEKRGRMEGNHQITTEDLKAMGYDNFEALASAIHTCEVEFHKLDGIKPFFRLHPPTKGYKRTIKRPYRAGGELGDRGEAINELASRMV
jgi:large subunit ribosomal protein L30